MDRRSAPKKWTTVDRPLKIDDVKCLPCRRLRPAFFGELDRLPGFLRMFDTPHYQYIFGDFFRHKSNTPAPKCRKIV